MKFAVVSLMPEMFDAIRNFGVTSRAFERNLVTLTVVNPRTFAEDRHGTVDDRPYGGGPGMVLKAEPMLAAVKAAKAAVGGRPIVVHFSPRGKPLDQGLLASWIEHFDEMVFLASRYEGLDERVIESVVDLEVCVGDFVVSGGELPAMMALDALIDASLLTATWGPQKPISRSGFAVLNASATFTSLAKDGVEV